MNRFHSLLLIITLFSVGCSTESTGPDPDDNLVVPSVYAFESRFTPGTSSVVYPGQTVRNLLMQDITSLISSAGDIGGTSVGIHDLLRLFDHNDADLLASTTSTGNLPPQERVYSTISTGKNLSGKVAPGDLPGTGRSVEQNLRAWFDSVAVLSADPTKLGTPMAYTTASGLDLAQLIDNVMLGSIAYYQGTTYYLGGILERDNGGPKGDGPYSDMEHAWDEAYGYFGAAREYNRFSDADLAGDVDAYTEDRNGSGTIDFQSEYNFPFARNAGKRDLGSSTSTDFTGEIFEAFRTGRAVIAGEGTRDEVLAERLKVARLWEGIIGATVVHYLNEIVSDMGLLDAESGPTNSATMNKHWAEMKGYLWALGFNSLGSVTSADLERWHSLVGSSPQYHASGSSENSTYLTDLTTVRDELGTTLGFDQRDIEGW